MEQKAEHTQHTSGPWGTAFSTIWSWGIRAARGVLAKGIRRQADANLIAAAPALLAACKAQAKFDQHAVHCDRCGRAEKYCDPGWQLWNTAGNLRNQAIAKAKGE